MPFDASENNTTFHVHNWRGSRMTNQTTTNDEGGGAKE